MKEKTEKSFEKNSSSASNSDEGNTPASTNMHEENDSDTLSDDELEVFKKIMGEIEGEEDGEAKPSDDASSSADGNPILSENEQREIEAVIDSIGDEPAEDTDTDKADDLDEDQQAAFDSIMAQIESGDSADAVAEEKEPEEKKPEETPDEPGGDDDFAAELEKVARAADPDDDEPAEDADADDADNLDEDQQAAFDSIMAQIESGDSADAVAEEKEPEEKKPEETPDEPGGDDDFAAELEKVARAADPDDDEPAEDADADDADNLDEDQQAAFDSIMAQIESGDSADAVAEEKEPEEKKPEETPDEPGGDDDFAAELEKVARAADPDDDEPAEDADADDADNLDEDQQAAFDSIMAQIESGDSADAVAEEKEPEEKKPEETPDGPDSDDDFAAELEKVARAADSDDDEPAEEADADDADDLDEDQQAAFDSIMAQIESGEGVEEESPKTSEAIVNPAEVKVPDVTDATGVADKKKNSRPSATTKQDVTAEAVERKAGPEPTPIKKEADAPIAPSGDENDGQPALPSNDATNSVQPGDEDAKPSSSAAVPVPEKKATQAPQEKKPISRNRKKWLWSAAVIFLIILPLTGYILWPHRQSEPTDSKPLVAQPSASVEATTPSPTAAAPPPPEKEEPAELPAVAQLKAIATALDQLRNELLAKQGEIEELRGYYQSGIDAEIAGILDSIRKSGKRTISLKAAMTDAHISLGLSAIQRRNAYIRRLKIPANALTRDSEELLYLTRKAELLASMAEKSSGIDVDGFVQESGEVMDVHRQRLNQLNIDAVDVIPLPMESLWQDISRRLPVKPASDKQPPAAVRADNAVIWKAICEGDFSRNDQLSMLSIEAARCLSAWKGKDLFLNALTDLPPDIARELVKWEGDWLGLNGLTELTPEVASHLARWKGRILSLNGLSRLSPQVVAILSEWRGEQIELINVKHMPNWDTPRIRLFFSEDLQRRHESTRK
ncbi:hypothetical protein DSCO28_06190 [Desulfosarcina ovata subsp. sediminis]|uniref:Uncharacterized protein n=1 Tax=Desulfosarcina ovata subsp. sediminis TaxID=885957 RepID=A0A5K7ZQW0_9BACT|nr:hypothetical protein [Desulfosarcina ovata]BBO80053.1 hypothetical protein DSCO28_06190 [Desulfosarcina ovata subsp. sediminis]